MIFDTALFAVNKSAEYSLYFMMRVYEKTMMIYSEQYLLFSGSCRQYTCLCKSWKINVIIEESTHIIV